MAATNYFLHLCQQTLAFLVYLWPMTLIFVFPLLISIVQAYYQKKKKIAVHLVLGMTGFIFSLLLLAWGSINRHQGQDLRAIGFQASLIGTGIFIGQILYGAFLVTKVPGYRFLVGTMVALQSWVSFYAFMVASMAVTGDWF